ncbi:unnamed protein product [Arabidopsis lyrata]|uniref:uncharacterized protein LOC9318303 isoform X1 n=1 Tax=Arabidopsis lyrata subsp. lyrata TaxID=81972 RepID=UPI000A29B7CF|nr:uncharacterized protein LOC9318303 isoform X1 [Arabidopsis lyrata subsp. lyrata]CAH8259044.1 unnamed protein product [Arabidopsis lyrata]|eukprot:XP_020888537.1 uncharacterized protein LOC9318303 isoform X1 [Arabidopsis lyrata subsp. lyrata]
MAIVRTSKLDLPNPSLSPSSPQVSSILYEPISSSLALTLSDSSISLYPSLSPLSTPSLSYPQTLIPSPCSSASFLLLRSQNPNSNDDSGNEASPRVFFIVAGPYRGGSRLLLRFYGLREGKNKGFVRAKVICDQKGIEFDQKVGVLLNLSHGVSVKIVGSTNYFSMYSVSSSKILIFGLKVVTDGSNCGDDDAVVVKLVRCGEIECVRPVWSIGIFSGLLILGEDDGVRVLNLREIVKGRLKKGRKDNGRLRNGHIVEVKKKENAVHVAVNKGLLSKRRQGSSETRMCFVSFQKNAAAVGADLKSETCVVMSLRAISIQALSIKRFLILDSAGYIHVLHVSGRHSLGSNFTCDMQQLPRFMDVQKLALLPEISVGTKSFWISDGDYSVHRVTISDEETTSKEKDEDKKIREERPPIQSSDYGAVTHTIFSPEKIQDLVPLGGNGALILGLRSLYAYAIS